MGMWAFEPWGNDEAADLFGDCMDRTQLRKEWLKGIDADPVEAPGTVRAATALFVMLGSVYVWPIKAFDQDLELTIASLSAGGGRRICRPAGTGGGHRARSGRVEITTQTLGKPECTTV